MSRIKERFARMRTDGRRGLIPFLTAGYPSLDCTRELILEFGNAGVAAIEVGVPFSDPMADGPVIQRSSEHALTLKVNLSQILQMLASIRLQTNVPLVLFSYVNPLLQFGLERLVEEGCAAGVDAILVTDLPFEESGEFHNLLSNANLDLIYLVSPTTREDRLPLIAERASGFIYVVARNGVTGPGKNGHRDAEILVTRLRQFTDLPVAVGFGIEHSEDVRAVLRFADAAVVGSAIIAEIERNASNSELVKTTGNFLRSLAEY